MKKLSLLFLTLCISLAGWAATSVNADSGWKHSNPFAYGLTSSLSDDYRTLSLTYSLNANAIPSNNNDYNYDNLNSSRGVQIYIVNKESGQRVKTITSGPITRGTWTVNVSTDDLPRDVELTWEVVVNGNKGRTTPQIIGSAAKNPVNAHGIGINTDPTHANFGQIFVSEGYPSSVDQKNSLLEFDPQLQYVGRHRKATHIISSSETKVEPNTYFSDALNYEPHRVKTTADGRVFVTCYHPTAGGAVLEYLGNNTFKNVIDFDKTANQGSDAQNSEHSRRVIGMDVKGTGDELKIVLAWIDANGYKFTSTYIGAKIEVYEYSLGEAESDGIVMPLPQVIGTSTTSSYVKKIGEEDDWRSATDKHGLLYQGFRDGWNSCLRGFVDVAYGKNDDIWMKIDYGSYATHPGRIILFRPNGNSVAKITEVLGTNTVVDGVYDDYFGGNALIYDDYYYGSSNKGSCSLIAGFSLGKIKGHKIEITDGATTKPSKMFSGQWEVANTESNSANRIGYWVTAFARDYAGNLYALTEKRDDYAGSTANNKCFNANILCIAMPYSGQRITRANSTFTLSDPVPNILATDLRYDIVRGKNQYEFSFNVNTKPEEAQIRFFESYEDMQKSLNVVNADNYDGTNANKPVYVYNIPDGQLKQGRIAVKLGAVGGQADANGVITNDRLPAGVLYWSVYVKTRKSCVFAPTCRLEGVTDTQGAHRRYATVNNYPETDMFGSFIVADNPAGDDVNGGYHGLMIYGINPEGNSNDEQSDISNGVRYSHRESYLNSGVASASDKLNFPRRLVVAPDGRVFIADQGTTDAPDYGGATSIVQHVRGGVRIWDPADPKKFTLFSHNKIGTSFGVSLWEHPAANGGLKIYASNAYEEYLKHNTTNNYTDQQKDGIFGWNGLAEYTLSAHPNGSANWSKPDSVHYALGRGDASGNYSLVAMDKGIWMCQHREHNRQLKDEALQPLADNLDAVLLSFFSYGSTKAETWNSCTNNGVKYYDDATKRAELADASDLTQKKTSPIQSTPGAGMAYRKIDGKEYLFVVNHDGNIAQILIDGWTGSGATATPIIDASKVKILVTPAYTKGDRDVSGTSTKWHTAFITTINFDYAGNLVTTTGKSFGQAHDIIVYTMPYDRVNAREIQAPNSCRMIPERIAQLDMTNDNMQAVITEHKVDHPTGCAVDIYRPLQGGMFNTICLPFELNLGDLPETHPLYGATLREYTGLNLNTIGGEKVLELVFTDVANKTIKANKPYIIQLKDDNGYNSIMRFAGPIQLTSTTGFYDTWFESDNTYSITYQGIIPYQRVEPQIDQVTGESLTLMLVADNRLAEMTAAGDMYGFRGYFTLNKPLPRGMQTRITTQKPVATNTTIVVDGKKVNVEKFLREGRVYIRVGDTLYGTTGEKVE